MIQSSLDQYFQSLRGQPNSRGDEVVYSPQLWALFTNWVKSSRASGSPPLRCTCRTPSSALCSKTASQSRVLSSDAGDAICKGLEQYAQWRGQRCVISAMMARGVSSIRSPPTVYFANARERRSHPAESLQDLRRCKSTEAPERCARRCACRRRVRGWL